MTGDRVDNLAVRFGDRRVVGGLSFSVAAGECLALVGESGSGKSQACLAPFNLSDGVAEGSVLLGGHQLIGLSEEKIRPLRGQGAGFVFQQPLSALTPPLRIGAQRPEGGGEGKECASTCRSRWCLDN